MSTEWITGGRTLSKPTGDGDAAHGPEAAMERMFRAAARLHRAQPWRVIPAEDAVLAVTIPELGVEDGRILVMGHDTPSRGVVLFRDEATLERYLDVCAQMASGAVDRPVFPPQLVLSFEARAEADPALVRQVEERRWELAGPSAFPALDAVGDDGVPRAPTAEERVKLEAVALAIAELVESTPDLGMILERQDGLAREIAVETSRGRATVAIATEERENPYADRPFDIHEDLGSDGDIDEERALAFEEELVRQFVESEEGVPLGLDAHWARGLLEHARKYHGVTVTELSPDVVEDVVFLDIPRQVSCEANEAPAIVASVRAFLAFLERAFGLGDMEECAAVLGKGAEAKLRQRLSDPRYFGMAKSFVMAGMKAGYDMRTKEGADAWMRVANGRLSNGSAPRPASKPDAAKKNERKAQRASRRKNRR